MQFNELILFSHNIKKQELFYGSVLNLEIKEKTLDSFAVYLQKSKLIFKYQKQSNPYHFAINIPNNQEEEALNWLNKRVKIIPFNNDEIIDFKTWNAKSIYFYDADNNIVEFIARKNLPNQTNISFSANNLIEISEIGVTTTSIKTIYNYLNTQLQLSIYDGGFKNFCAIGTEKGLFIVVNRNTKKWFPTNDIIYPSNFILKLTHNNRETTLSYQNEKFN